MGNQFCSLYKIILTVHYWSRQGLVIHGHQIDEENFIELLKLHSNDNETLGSQLKRKQDYTSPTIQNEIISLMSREVIRTIVKEINCGSQYHSVIADRTQHYIDIVCRRSVHLHHIDPAMQTNENLVIISYTPNNSMDFIGKIAY